MKKILFISAIALFSLNSCFKDSGNYDYTEPEVITVTDINASYDKVSQIETLKITPGVTSTDPNARFEYFWGIYETNVQGSIPRLDTICKTKELNLFVNKPAKTWVLVFGAKNVNTGYSSLTTSNLNVITQFTRGWYVLKDDGTATDLDLFTTPTSITPGIRYENMYSLVNGKKLTGKAKSVCFDPTYKSTVTGVLGNTRAMFIISDKDASIINTNTLLEIRNFNSCFYAAPSVKAPNLMTAGNSSDFFVNDGQLYTIYGQGSNSGIFGSRVMKDAVNTPYRLSDYYVTHWMSNPLLFDETSSSFVSAGGSSATLNTLTDVTGTAMSANRNNKTMLYMGIKSSSPLTGVAVLQDKTNPGIKIVSLLTPLFTTLKISNDTITASQRLYNATKYSCNYDDENILYFVVGNEVWSRNLTNKFEQLQYTVPSDETITYIRHKKYSAEAPYAYNFVVIGTKKGTNYTVRMFTKTAGNLASTPTVTLTGTGSVGDVYYLSPSVSYYTYHNSY